MLAYLRTYEDEQVLCVANLSRFAQPVDLDLSKLEGMVPVEMLGYVEFPADRAPALPAHAWLPTVSCGWNFSGETSPPRPARDLAEQAPLNVTAGWESIFEGMGRQRLETVNLPEYLPKQRWFAGKSRAIKSTRIIDWAPLSEPHSALVLVEVQFEAGEPEVYLVPLAMTLWRSRERIAARRTERNHRLGLIGEDGRLAARWSVQTTTYAWSCSR